LFAKFFLGKPVRFGVTQSASHTVKDGSGKEQEGNHLRETDDKSSWVAVKARGFGGLATEAPRLPLSEGLLVSARAGVEGLSLTAHTQGAGVPISVRPSKAICICQTHSTDTLPPCSSRVR